MLLTGGPSSFDYALVDMFLTNEAFKTVSVERDNDRCCPCLSMTAKRLLG